MIRYVFVPQTPTLYIKHHCLITSNPTVSRFFELQLLYRFRLPHQWLLLESCTLSLTSPFNVATFSKPINISSFDKLIKRTPWVFLPIKEISFTGTLTNVPLLLINMASSSD